MEPLEEMLRKLRECTDEYVGAEAELTRLLSAREFNLEQRERAQAAKLRRDVLRDQYGIISRAVWHRRFEG